MLTLIEHGEVYTPEYAGIQSVLLSGDTIVRIGTVDRDKLLATDLPCEIIDASGCIITPGFIDPHEHIIGAGGEQGFASRMPEVLLDQIVTAGITTVVGCLGTDATTRHLTSLLAKVRQLEEQGITAYMYTGSFQVPTPTITASVTDDLVIIDKVIGVGEIAIADVRSLEPSLHELARLVSASIVGGTLSGKSGVTHFHTGPAQAHLSLLHTLLDTYEIAPEYLYPTHINRSEALMDDAITLARRGAYVDIDTVEEDLGKWLRYYHDHDGVPSQLTVSSDAHTPGGSPQKLFQQFVSCIREHGFQVDEVLPCFTQNCARALKLHQKGQLQEQKDADLLVLNKETLELNHVIARGHRIVAAGKLIQD